MCAVLWCCWLCFVFCVGIVYSVVVFVLVVFGGFLDVPCGHKAWKVKWRVKLQVFATLILGARGRSNIFQHQKASARCLAMSILFQGGPGIGSTKRIQNRFRLEGAPAVPGMFVLKDVTTYRHTWAFTSPVPEHEAFFFSARPSFQQLIQEAAFKNAAMNNDMAHAHYSFADLEFYVVGSSGFWMGTCFAFWLMKHGQQPLRSSCSMMRGTSMPIMRRPWQLEDFWAQEATALSAPASSSSRPSLSRFFRCGKMKSFDTFVYIVCFLSLPEGNPRGKLKCITCSTLEC